jgi:hypothetical protein
MRKQLFALFAAFALLGLTSQAADAHDRRGGWWWPWSVKDPKLSAAHTAVGVSAAVGYFVIADHHRRVGGAVTPAGAYALTAVGCAALSPIVGTVVTRRELTHREVHTMTANCVLPILGGLIVNAAYENNPHWERPVRRKR